MIRLFITRVAGRVLEYYSISHGVAQARHRPIVSITFWQRIIKVSRYASKIILDERIIKAHFYIIVSSYISTARFTLTLAVRAVIDQIICFKYVYDISSPCLPPHFNSLGHQQYQGERIFLFSIAWSCLFLVPLVSLGKQGWAIDSREEKTVDLV